MTTCTKCGAHITNIILIDGLPYGSDCAETVLGIKQLPSWFKGGDWDKAKAENDKFQLERAEQFKLVREYTRKHWNDFMRLSIALKKARSYDNVWEINFISSLSEQAGFNNLTSATEYSTMDEAEKNWKFYNGSFPYLYNDIKGLSALSDKQINIFERIENN